MSRFSLTGSRSVASKSLQREFGLTYLFISHNLAVIRQISHRTAVMHLGRIVELAETEKIYNEPKHPYTSALVSAVPIPDPSRRTELAAVEGDVPSPVNIPPGCRFNSRCPYATEKCRRETPLSSRLLHPTESSVTKTSTSRAGNAPSSGEASSQEENERQDDDDEQNKGQEYRLQ